MQQLSLIYRSSIINYYVFGSGTEILFCLHGYGEDGSSFSFLEDRLDSMYTLFAIDFPYHGKTTWNENRPFATGDLVAIMDLMLPDNHRKFSLLAYSMGGRAAMHLLQQLPARIKRVALIAPDGLHINFWYWATTQTNFGNRFFAYTMKRPGWFFSALNTANRLNIYNKSVVKFVHYYLDDTEQRTLLYKRWTCMREMRPDLQLIKGICVEKGIPLNFLFGKYDRIILSKRADTFKNVQNISIKVIEAGHQLLKEKYADEITALLCD